MDQLRSYTGGFGVPAKRSIVRRLLGALIVSIACTATAPAFAGDSCKMVLCMYGKLAKSKGEGTDGGSECNGAVAEYFGILVYKKKKKIDWSATAKERLKRQNSCSSAERKATKAINDKFGKKLG